MKCFCNHFLIIGAFYSLASSSKDDNGSKKPIGSNVLKYGIVDGSRSLWVNGKLKKEEYFGYENWSYQIKYSSSTQIGIGSNSKFIAALAIYQLQEKGLLKVTDNVNDYLDQKDFEYFGHPTIEKWCPKIGPSPDSTAPCENITFLQLMTMKSGLIDEGNCKYPKNVWQYAYCQDYSFIRYPGIAPYSTFGSYIGKFIHLPLSEKPGTMYRYNNENWVILSYIVTKLTGIAYAKYLKDHIFDPMGMKDSFFDNHEQQGMNRPNFAQSYLHYYDPKQKKLGIGKCTQDFILMYAQGAGGFVSTQKDMNKLYLGLFIHKNAPILTQDSVYHILHDDLTDTGRPFPPGGVLFPSAVAGLTSYFASGILVAYASNNIAAPWPIMIAYQGDLICQHALNMALFMGGNSYLSTSFGSSTYVNITKTAYDAYLADGETGSIDGQVQPFQMMTAASTELINEAIAKQSYNDDSSKHLR